MSARGPFEIVDAQIIDLTLKCDQMCRDPERDHEARDAQGRLALSLGIYQLMERGDFQRAKEEMGMIVLGQTRYYEYEFGVPTGTNFWVRKFATAQAIASQVESNLVPVSSILTNVPHTPDAKITIENQKD